MISLAMPTKARTAHPAAMLFPMMADAELQELAEDIHRNGLLEPIVLSEDMILDGRGRWAACELAGVTARYVEYEGESPTEYVISKNMPRRRFTISQQAAIAAQAVPLLKAEVRKRRLVVDSHDILDRLARLAGVGSTTVWEAEQVCRLDPEGFGRLQRGEASVHGLYRKLKKIALPPPVVSPARQPMEERARQVRALAAQGYRSEQIGKQIGVGVDRVKEVARISAIPLPADAMRMGRKIDVNRVINETVSGAQALIAGLELIDERLEQVDKTKVGAWIESLSSSIGSLNRMLRQLRKIGGTA